MLSRAKNHHDDDDDNDDSDDIVTTRVLDAQTSSSRDDITKPAWCAGNDDRGGQCLDTTDHMDVDARPRSSSCSQAQRHPAKCGAAVPSVRPFTPHRRDDGMSQSSYIT